MNYERLIQWLAGPIAALIAWGATSLVHTTISHSQALQVATFVTAGAVTFLAHQKWLTNLAKWWEHSGIAAPAGILAGDTGDTPEPPASKYVGQAPDYSAQPTLPDRSGIPTGPGPLLNDSGASSAADELSSSDEFSDQPPEAVPVSDIPASTTPDPAPNVTGVTGVTDQGEKDPAEKLRDQIRRLGGNPEA